MDDFPANSQRSKIVSKHEEAHEEEKQVKKVVSGSVIQRKKPMRRRFTETFFGGDNRGVVDYVVFDVAIPAAKDLFADVVTQGVERRLFGEARSVTRRSGLRSSGIGHTPYNRMSSSRPTREEPRHTMSRRARQTHDFNEIILGTRREADDVLEQLDHLVQRYGTASVADLYDLVGADRSYTDAKYGWDDLRSARAVRITQGYLLELPRPEPLD